MNDGPTFGALLKRFRRLAHLTQADLAERAGYSFHYVSMLERGVRSPLPATADTLAAALGLAKEDSAALHAAAGVLPAIAAALQIPELPGRSALDRVGGYLRARKLLLLLDNFERALD